LRTSCFASGYQKQYESEHRKTRNYNASAGVAFGNPVGQLIADKRVRLRGRDLHNRMLDRIKSAQEHGNRRPKDYRVAPGGRWRPPSFGMGVNHVTPPRMASAIAAACR
jgi:hypothetical protein